MTEAASEAHDEIDPRLGRLIDGRYRLLRRLGAGGFGTVYEAEHEVIKRRVAVKMLHASVAAEPEVIARFRREAIAATSISHPHIVEVLDMGRADDGAAYMVLELLEGHDWASELDAQGPQPLGRTVRIALQVLDGLAAAHDKGIVHRDLKAQNVFLVKREAADDFVKIVDFGISKFTEEGGGSDVVLTRTGTAMGTPVAMSPEQLQGRRDVDHRSDLWAVGVMLHHALTGTYPFTADTFAMLAVNVITVARPPLAALRPDLPPEIDTIVGRLLEKLREKRFASARDVREALAPFADHDEARRADVAPPTPETKNETRHDVERPIGVELAATNVHDPSLSPIHAEAPRVVEAAPSRVERARPSVEAPASLDVVTSDATSTPATTTTPLPASPAPMAILALAVGGLLVGGTWWIASARDPRPPEPPRTIEVITPVAIDDDAGSAIEEPADAFVIEEDVARSRARRDPTLAHRDEEPDAGERPGTSPPPATSEPPQTTTTPPPTTTTIGPTTIETPPTTRGGLRRPH